MIKRTIEISSEPAHLTVKHRQLLVKREGETVGQAPCEDIGVVIVDHRGTTYSHAALTELVRSDAALVICGDRHLPTGVLLPLVDHGEVIWRINDQIECSKPLAKRIWKQVVQEKIRNQAMVLGCDVAAHRKLLAMSRQVRSGDTTNVEAQAARVYWRNFLSDDDKFHRDQNGDGLNSFLNYGYAIVRAAVARAITSAGMLPAIGIHHHARSNPFCLADDLMEPFRPLVDFIARDTFQQGYVELNPESKRALLSLMSWPTQLKDEQGPLMVNLQRMCSSFARVLSGDASSLQIPSYSLPES